MVMAVVAVLWLGLDPSAPCADTGICLQLFLDPQSWWIDIGLGVATAIVVLLLWEITRRSLPLAQAMEQELARVVGVLRVDEAVAIALLSGFAEEFFFRGAVQGSLGWPLATLAFALLHTGPGRALKLWTLYAGLVGLLLAGLMEWRGNLLAPVLAHVLINVVGLTRLALRDPAKTSTDDSEGRLSVPSDNSAPSDNAADATTDGEGTNC